MHTHMHGWIPCMHACLHTTTHELAGKYGNELRKKTPLQNILYTCKQSWHVRHTCWFAKTSTHTPMQCAKANIQIFVLPMIVNQHSAWIIGLHYGFSPQPTCSHLFDIVQRNKHAHTAAASRPSAKALNSKKQVLNVNFTQLVRLFLHHQKLYNRLAMTRRNTCSSYVHIYRQSSIKSKRWEPFP